MKVLISALVLAVVTCAVFAFTAKEKNVAKFAVTDLGRGHYIIKIRSVETQVVRGTMYHIKAKVGYQIPGGIHKEFECFFKVWERLGGRQTVEESNCK